MRLCHPSHEVTSLLVDALGHKSANAGMKTCVKCHGMEELLERNGKEGPKMMTAMLLGDAAETDVTQPRVDTQAMSPRMTGLVARELVVDMLPVIQRIRRRTRPAYAGKYENLRTEV